MGMIQTLLDQEFDASGKPGHERRSYRTWPDCARAFIG